MREIIFSLIRHRNPVPNAKFGWAKEYIFLPGYSAKP
jgi:hypothetical protein